MKGKLLEDLSLAHQDALEADQKSPRTIRYYRQRQEATLRDLAALLGRAPTLADWLDPELQRRRYRGIAERERSGQWLQHPADRRRAAPQLRRDLPDALAPFRQEMNRAAFHLP